MISIIINTCCLENTNALSNAKQPHAQRAYALRNWILPAYIADPYIDEIFVVGAFEAGEGFTYIPCPSWYFSWKDCLEKRQVGFEASSGDVLIFQHDDHVLGSNGKTIDHVVWYYPPIKDFNEHVWSPARYTRLRNVNGERLNNGEPENNRCRINDTFFDGYISGHLAIYRREVIEVCQWKDVPQVYTMDVEHTKQIREAGFKIVHTDAIKIWDVEQGSEPWK